MTKHIKKTNSWESKPRNKHVWGKLAWICVGIANGGTPQPAGGIPERPTLNRAGDPIGEEKLEGDTLGDF
eukprot:11186206-Lingulodinium_polyedra.AAC.1